MNEDPLACAMPNQPINPMEVTPASLALKEIHNQLIEISNAIYSDCSQETLHTYMVLCAGAMLAIAGRGLQGIVPNQPPGEPWKITEEGQITI